MADIDSPESARSFIQTYWSPDPGNQRRGRKYPPLRHVHMIIESQKMCLSIEQASRYSEETRERRRQTIAVFVDLLPEIEADHAAFEARLDAKIAKHRAEHSLLDDLEAVKARVRGRK
jgi:hypothetical protein